MLNVIYLHYCFITIYFIIEIFLLAVLIFVLFRIQSFYLSFPLLYCIDLNNIFSVNFDWISLIFSSIVIFIASVMSIFRFYYFRADNYKTMLFLFLKFLFVLRILLVILFRDFFFIILGWDGLGFVSFLLILFYQRSSSIYSALFTILINRIGDAFYLLRLSLILFFNSSIYLNYYSLLLLRLMLLTFITKSALFPFSRWLPIAMAAPTPISALVHSSTLVTAGLYLIIRYSFIFYSSYKLIQLLLIVSLFTSFYAGTSVLVESDLKKVIALSTLSHLGFIGIAFSLGLSQLAFFHLLRHALFKSLLFIRIGDIIVNLIHSQDRRYISNVFVSIPYSTNLIRLRLLNLLGLPNIRGFYSKDLILEFFLLSSNSLYLYVILICNLVFTFYYTFVLLNMSHSSSKIRPYFLLFKPSYLYIFISLILALMSIFFGIFCLNYVLSVRTVSVISLLKFFPQVLLISFLVGRIFLFQLNFITSKNFIILFSSILYLHLFLNTVFKKVFLIRLFYLFKSLEHGIFYNLINSSIWLVSRKLNIFFIKRITISWYLIFFGWIFLLWFIF